MYGRLWRNFPYNLVIVYCLGWVRFLPRSSGANWIGAMRKKSQKNSGSMQVKKGNLPSYKSSLEILLVSPVAPQFLFHMDHSERKSLRIFFCPQKKKDLWPLDVVATRHLKEICMECDALAIACGISSHLVLRFLSSWFPWLKTGAFNEVVRCPGHRELFGDFLPRNWDMKITTKVSWTQNFKLG